MVTISAKGSVSKPFSLIQITFFVVFTSLALAVCVVYFFIAPNHQETILSKTTNVLLTADNSIKADLSNLRKYQPPKLVEQIQLAPPLPAVPIDLASGNLVYINMTMWTTQGMGSAVIEINREWAPLGAARFVELVQANFFDEARFFRVLKVSPSC